MKKFDLTVMTTRRLDLSVIESTNAAGLRAVRQIFRDDGERFRRRVAEMQAAIARAA